MPDSNGVIERNGQWFLDVGRCLAQAHPTVPELGPFPSRELADAVASYVFAHWITHGHVPTRGEALAAVRA